MCQKYICFHTVGHNVGIKKVHIVGLENSIMFLIMSSMCSAIVSDNCSVCPVLCKTPFFVPVMFVRRGNIRPKALKELQAQLDLLGRNVILLQGPEELQAQLDLLGRKVILLQDPKELQAQLDLLGCKVILLQDPKA